LFGGASISRTQAESLVVDKRYKSSIPAGAKEQVVTEYRCDADRGGCTITLRTTECRYRGKIVGMRCYEEDGMLVRETPLKGDKAHGIHYMWYDSGALEFAQPYLEGLQHGTTRQWSEDGRLMGTYTLIRGTGLAVWRNQLPDGTVYISQIYSWRNGCLDGFMWWFGEGEASAWCERYFQSGRLHGIERRWNDEGGLRRGYPKYYVQGKQLAKRAYVRAAEADPTLPPFRVEENRPVRVFPPEVRKKLGLQGRRRASR
jgi:hypothetical protein